MNKMIKVASSLPRSVSTLVLSLCFPYRADIQESWSTGLHPRSFWLLGYYSQPSRFTRSERGAFQLCLFSLSCFELFGVVFAPHRTPNNSFTISKRLTATNPPDRLRKLTLLLTRKVPLHLPQPIPKVHLSTLLALTITIKIKKTRILMLEEEEEVMREGKMIKGLENLTLKWLIVTGQFHYRSQPGFH